MKALILAPFSPSGLDRLKKLLDGISYQSWMETKRLLSSAEFITAIQEQGYEILVVEADFLQREVFEKAPNLKLVGCCRADLAHIDLAAANEFGVPIINTPGRNAVAVAELTIGLMLSLLRHIPTAHHMVQSGQWTDPMAAYLHMRGSELWNKTVGIAGLGAIGRQVARRLAAFDTRILATDPHVSAETMKSLGATPTDLDSLMQQSDVVSIHCSTTQETTGLISAGRIALMKPTAYLVNAASSYVIDEAALVDALRQHRIAGAAFDVYKAWPVKPDDPILDLDNVVLTPHIGGATDESVARHSMMIVEGIETFLKGQRPGNLANPQVWKGHV